MTKLADSKTTVPRRHKQRRLDPADALRGCISPSPFRGEPHEILAEAVRRDAELATGRVKPLSENTFWAGVRRARK
jgi:hypothetical protein